MSSVPMPLNDPIARPRKRGLKTSDRDENEGKLTEVWIPYMQSQNSIAATSIRLTTSPVALSAQAASIGVTAIPTTSLAAGLYRIAYYTRITTASGATSSLTVTIHWTDGGIACSLSSAALTANTTSTVGTGTALVNIDGASPVSYSTTYASTGVPVMSYALYLTLEAMNQ